jgi:hypothetical protein
MLLQEYGSTFVGYTGAERCDNCGTFSSMFVFQDYIKQSVLLIPLGKTHSAIYRACPVCEKKEYIVKNTFLGGGDMQRRLLEMLDQGKEHTKTWYQGLPDKEKEGVLKRLNALKAFKVVQHIAT